MASFEHGQMYVAPAHQPHPPLEFAVIRLEVGRTKSHSRLSIDALFRAVATPCGCRLVGAILTGVVCNDRARGVGQMEKSATTLTGYRRERS
jgi:chemotaxis response regulator CheB